MKRGRFKVGKQEGVWYEWSNLGLRLYKTSYKDGWLHGSHTAWNARGELVAEGAYREGREAGEWTFYPTYERENLERRTFSDTAPQEDE